MELEGVNPPLHQRTVAFAVKRPNRFDRARCRVQNDDGGGLSGRRIAGDFIGKAEDFVSCGSVCRGALAEEQRITEGCVIGCGGVFGDLCRLSKGDFAVLCLARVAPS